MADLDKLFEGFKKGRMLYPQPRRASEDEFFAELVARLKAIDAHHPYLLQFADIIAEIAAAIDEHFGKQVSLRVLALHTALSERVPVETIYARWEAERKANLANIIATVEAEKAAPDRMAAARAAKAAKRDAPAPEAA